MTDIVAGIRFGVEPTTRPPLYPLGEAIEPFLDFLDRDTGDPLAVTGVACRLFAPGGAEITPAPTPVEVSAGLYTVPVTLATYAGEWTLEASCTGPVAATVTRAIIVRRIAPGGIPDAGARPVTSVAGRTGNVVLTAADSSFTPPLAGAEAQSVFAILRRLPFHVREYGAEGDGTNESVKLHNALNAAEDDGIATVQISARHRITGDLVIPTGVEIEGRWFAAGERNGTDYAAQQSALLMESGSVDLRWGGGLRRAGVFRYGLTKPADTVRSLLDCVAAFSGTGIKLRGNDTIGGQSEQRIEDVCVLGFDLGIDIYRSERARLDKLMIDCTNGWRLERVRDIARMRGVHVYSTVTNRYNSVLTSYDVASLANSGGLLQVTTTAAHPFVTGDSVNVVLTSGTACRKRSAITVISSTVFTCADIPYSASYSPTSGKVWPAVLWRDGIGGEIVDAERVTIFDCFVYGQATGFRAGDASSWATFIGCDYDNYQSASVDSSVGFEFAGTARGGQIIGGETNSCGVALRVNTPGALPHRVVGMEMNHYTGGTAFDIVAGRVMLSACETFTAGAASIGAGADKVTLASVQMPSITLTNSAAAGVVLIDSTCDFANATGGRGEIDALIVGAATAGGGQNSALHLRGSPTADAARGAEIRMENVTAGQSFFLRTSSSGNFLALNNAGSLVYSLTQAGVFSMIGLSVTGTTTLTGPLGVTGATTLTGATVLAGNASVTAGGNLTIGAATAGGGPDTTLHLRGSPTADPARGGELRIENPTAAQSFFLRVSSGGNLLALNNAGASAVTLTQAGQMTLAAGLFLTPGALLTPASNGQVAVDFPSDTSLRFRARGSDGVLREATLTLA